MHDLNKIIAEEDYETIIRKWLNKKNVQVTQHSVSPLSDKVEGFLGDHYILKISALDNGKAAQYRFFMKTFPTQDTQIDVANNIHGFEREILFFEDHVKEFERTIPNYKPTFAPRFLLGNKHKTVVFEDLSVKKYCAARMQHLFEMDLNHVKVVLESLAKLHASSLAYEEIRTRQSGKIYRIFKNDVGIYREEHFRKSDKSLVYEWMRTSVGGVCALLEKIPQTKLTKQKLYELLDNYCDLMKDQSKFRMVMGHNDTWNKNILFKYNHGVPVRAKLVDYQFATYCPPGQDIGFFIYQNASKEVKENHFLDALNFYYSCLAQELRKYDLNVMEILPLSEIVESLKFLLPTIKLRVLLYNSMLCANDEYMTLLTKDSDRYREFIHGDRGPFCLELWSDSYYREKVTSSLLDFEATVCGLKVKWEETIVS